jgi:hypothetical protein
MASSRSPTLMPVSISILFSDASTICSLDLS